MMMTHSDTDQETLIHPDPGHHDQDIVFSDLIYDVIIRECLRRRMVLVQLLPTSGHLSPLSDTGHGTPGTLLRS